ncbi:hypothetical protein BDN72DRAFT_809725 [Pluteus cervinus]|uniref:Uncharacterized protein n=1 Tax=Pluteus cervinus TaxID=181527 RepID=A0ACD3BE86_9AGAR|nr:hypothetical protein BDN72DRAFT_809725 [Pluteus cervinus]
MAQTLTAQVIDLTLEDEASSSLLPSTREDASSSKRRSSRRKKPKSSSGTALASELNSVTVPGEETTQKEVIEILDEDDDLDTRPAKRQSTTTGTYNNDALRQKDPAPSPPPTDNLFYIDTTPSVIPTSIIHDSNSLKDDLEVPKLLLPVHVSVFGDVPVEILRPPEIDGEGEDYIEYLDYDDRKDMVRYFEQAAQANSKPAKIVCKHCGAEGDHKAQACPVIICLTCGARNEHSTRSCPISKTCFSCGMKGHINSSCPYKYTGRPNSSRYGDCDRCNSTFHQTSECPTLWRLYEYLKDDQRDLVIQVRQSKSLLPLGGGGEGYIAEDEWCYNCGDCGHWGDDCTSLSHVHDLPMENSAHSLSNISTGPFADIESGKVVRGPRMWEQEDSLPDGWGKSAPQHVGRQGRRKEVERMVMKAREQADDDQDDWFGRAGRRAEANGRSHKKGNGENEVHGKKMNFGISLKGAAQRFDSINAAGEQQEQSARPSLLNRISDSYDGRARHSERDRRPSGGDRENGEHKHRPRSGRDNRHGRERSRERERERDYRGPRYRGGYGR